MVTVASRLSKSWKEGGAYDFSTRSRLAVEKLVTWLSIDRELSVLGSVRRRLRVGVPACPRWADSIAYRIGTSVGNGPNRERQEGPHPHWVGTDPANRFLFVPDLGSDQVMVYGIDKARAPLKAHGSGHCSPGSGPRHFVFHPNGRFAYVINELTITVTAFSYDSAAGTLDEIQTIDSLPEKVHKVFSSGSEICIHPSGHFLYAANRGDDSITVFGVNPETGRLTYVEREPIRGSHPHCFNLDPSGKWLLATRHDWNTISVFRINAQLGRLVYNEQIVNSPAPLRFALRCRPMR